MADEQEWTPNRAAVRETLAAIDVAQAHYPACALCVLANPRPLAEPIPYKGALGLRRLDDDTTARVLAQIGGA